MAVNVAAVAGYDLGRQQAEANVTSLQTSDNANNQGGQISQYRGSNRPKGGLFKAGDCEEPQGSVKSFGGKIGCCNCCSWKRSTHKTTPQDSNFDSTFDFVKPFTSPNDDKRSIRQYLKNSGIPASAIREGGDAMESSKCLIAPRGTFRSRWDILVIVALGFTAVVTPLETAFLPTVINLLFIVNRLVDGIFMLDIGFNFCTPVFSPSKNRMVWTHAEIAVEYAKFWLLIDVISVIPFDIIGLFSDNTDLSKWSGLSVIRLLRLAKLLRIFRASRILKRWESRLSVSHNKLQLVKFALTIMMLGHWMACGFKLVQELESVEFNWVTAYFEDNFGLAPGSYPWESVYLVSLYWAVMTITTIGYGDVLPVTDAERWYCVVAMMFGGSVYAYIIGAICGIVASMDEIDTHFHQRIDHLNRYLEENEIPNSMRWKVREFFYNSKNVQKRKGTSHLLNDLSPDMQQQLVLFVNSKALTSLPFLHCAPAHERRLFVTAIAAELTESVFPALESIAHPGDVCNSLMVVGKGSVLLNRSFFISPTLNPTFVRDDELAMVRIEGILSSINREVLNEGMCFGEEMVLQNGQRGYHVVTLSYVELNVLSKDSLDKILAQHSELLKSTTKNLRQYAIKLSFAKTCINAIYKHYRNPTEAVHHSQSTGTQPNSGKKRAGGTGEHKLLSSVEMDSSEEEEKSPGLDGIGNKVGAILMELKRTQRKIERLESNERARLLLAEKEANTPQYTYINALKPPTH